MLNSVGDLEDDVRRAVNEDEARRDTEFPIGTERRARLATALDTLGDTCLALEQFKRCGFAADEPGTQYLLLYGTLQALFLQQDAISTLCELFAGCKFDRKSLQAWSRIREWRNAAVGHPVSRHLNRRTVISRSTVGGYCFQIWVWEPDRELGRCCEEIDLLAEYLEYEREAVSIRETVLSAAKRQLGNIA